MNPVSVSPSITSYEAPKTTRSLFQEASRSIEERFSSVPRILEPAYEDFLERFLAETLLSINETPHHPPKVQLDLLLFVVQLVLCRAAADKKTLDPTLYIPIQEYLIASLIPFLKKIVSFQHDSAWPHLNLALFENLKVEDPFLFQLLIVSLYVEGLSANSIKTLAFTKPIRFYETAFSRTIYDQIGSAQISAEKCLSATYFSWITTLLNILENPNPRSMNALKGPLLEFSSLFLRSSLLHLYQVKSGDRSNTSLPFLLSHKIEKLRWNHFFNAIEFKTKLPISGTSLDSPFITRCEQPPHRSSNRFYKQRHVEKDIRYFTAFESERVIFCLASSFKYFCETTHSKYDKSAPVILFVAQKIDKKNTKVSPIPFPLKDQETLSNLKVSLNTFLSLPHPPFLLVELLNLLDWLLEEGFSARHYPFLLHTFHRILDYSILNMLQTHFPSETGNPSQNIQDYFPALKEAVSESLVNSINDVIMGEALDSFITSHHSRSAKEIVAAIEFSERSLTSEEHHQIASQFVTQIEPLIRVFIELITSLCPYISQESSPPPSSEPIFIASPDRLEPIYREALVPSGAITPEKNLAGIYLNWAATLLTRLETPTKYPAYALDGIFNESLDLFLRFSFLDFYKLTKDPHVDCTNLDALPKALKNYEWEDFLTVMGLPRSELDYFSEKTYTCTTRYWGVRKTDNRPHNKPRVKKQNIQLMNAAPASYYSNTKKLFQKYIATYLFSLQRADVATLQAIALSKNPPYLMEIVKNIEKEHAQVSSIPFNQKDKETLKNLITSLGVFLSLQNYPFLLPDLLHLLYWLNEEGFSTRHYPFLLHAFHRIAEYAILDSLQKWFSRRNPDSSKNIEDYFPYLIDNLHRPDLADRIGALILKNDLDYFIHPEARTGAQEIMEAVHLSNLELPPEECEKVASRFIEQIKPLLDLLIELIDQLNRYKPSIRNRNLDHLEKMFPLLTKELE